MARSGDGGMNIWCPQCKKIQICEAIQPRSVTSNTKDYARRQYFRKHKDVRWKRSQKPVR